MAKSVLYGAGVRVIVPREQKVRPWAHVLLGGIHMFPQTAFSNNGFAAHLGGGADLRLRSWLWLRMEGDYIRSQLYTQGQNNFQNCQQHRLSLLEAHHPETICRFNHEPSVCLGPNLEEQFNSSETTHRQPIFNHQSLEVFGYETSPDLRCRLNQLADRCPACRTLFVAYVYNLRTTAVSR